MVGLFAGIGGFEQGLQAAGHHTIALCEVSSVAEHVLKKRFKDVQLHSDIKNMMDLPEADLVTAGFPCQDLSQAGQTAGIGGDKSGIVKRVFELVEKAKHRPPWLLFENVPFMLSLDKGSAMGYLTGELAKLGYRWAYRVVDARAFGLPQRRKRVLILASREHEPRDVLLSQDIGTPPELDRVPTERPDVACGFYWTEGNTGWGWAVDAIPTLKGGSGFRIPSPPAVLLPDCQEIVIPSIRSAECLMGFSPDWTLPAARDGSSGERERWRLVGNAVSVRLAHWIGRMLAQKEPPRYQEEGETPILSGRGWPSAGWGEGEMRFSAQVSPWPERRKMKHLLDLLSKEGMTPLSRKAALGFYNRITANTNRLRIPKWFKDCVKEHIDASAHSTCETANH